MEMNTKLLFKVISALFQHNYLEIKCKSLGRFYKSPMKVFRLRDFI